MNVADLKKLIEDLPDDTPIDIFNNAAEWYGVEIMNVNGWRLLEGRLVFHFLNDWLPASKYSPGDEQRYKDSLERE